MISKILWTHLVIFGLSLTAYAGDKGFRYVNHECVNAKGEKGYNPSYFGQCADFRGVVLGNISLDGIDFSGSLFNGANFEKSTLKAATLVGVDFSGANLVGVNFDGAVIQKSSFKKSILKNISLFDAETSEVDFSEADFKLSDLSYAKFKTCNFEKADFSGVKLEQAEFTGSLLNNAIFENANLTSAQLQNINVTNGNFQSANFAKADLSGATFTKSVFNSATWIGANLTKVSLVEAKLMSAKMDGVNFTDANLTSADLRGTSFSQAVFKNTKLSKAIYNKKTILPITDQEALNLGMIFKKMGNVLLLWDNNSNVVNRFAQDLKATGECEVTLGKQVGNAFTGSDFDLSLFDVVIYLNATTYNSDMPMAGQTALVNFVKKGGKLIYTEWTSYSYGVQNFFQGMSGLILTKYQTGNGAGSVQISAAKGQETHALFDKIKMPMTVNVSGYNVTKVLAFDQNPAVVLAMTNAGGGDFISMRRIDQGQVIGFGFLCDHTNTSCFADTQVKQLYLNAILMD